MYITEILGGPMDGLTWSQSMLCMPDDKLTFTRQRDGLQAIYFYHENYRGRGGRFVYWRSQLPIKQRAR